jgi:uncharacterized peroxidase-related enzyme
MAYVEVTPYEDSAGTLREEYDAAIGRAGRIWNIVSVQGQLPEVLRESMRLYREVMFGPSPLTRAQRELLAAVTSSANSTRYCTTAHWHDYRDEVGDQGLVDRVMDDWRTADIDEADRALIAFAEKLTWANSTVGPAEIEELRAHGFDDRAISSAVQVVAYFNYINRVADGLGVDREEWIEKDGREKPVA